MKQCLKNADRIPTEHEEQRQFVAWFEKHYPGIRIFHIPNGGKRNPVTAQRLKLDGVKPGVPDLFIPEWGLWIEMKRTKKSYLSVDQKDWHQYLHGIGYQVATARGCVEAIALIDAFVPTMFAA